MSFQAGKRGRWYVADLQTRGPEWSGIVSSSVVNGSHFASHGTSRSLFVRTIERASEPGPPVRSSEVRQRAPAGPGHRVQPGVTPEQCDGYPAARAWFEAERPVLLAVIQLAAACE